MASININGLSLPYKQLSLLDLINQNKYSIFGISETHLSIKEGRFLNKEIPTYTSFWSSYTNSRQAGVGIFIHHSISKYIARSHNFNGHIVGVDLNFRNNPIRLLQVYFPTAEKKQLRKEVQEEIIKLCLDTTYKIILMGDLNSVPNPRQDRLPPKKSSIPESQLIKFLISQQFKDTYRLFFPKKSKFTFSRADSYSRIDQIWTNISVTLLDYTDIVSELQLESDHQLITLELTLQISQSLPTKQKSRKCFQWKKCNKE